MGSNSSTVDKHGVSVAQTKRVYVAVTFVCWIMYIVAIYIGICVPRHDADDVVKSSVNQESYIHTPDTSQEPLNTLVKTDDNTPCLW